MPRSFILVEPPFREIGGRLFHFPRRKHRRNKQQNYMDTKTLDQVGNMVAYDCHAQLRQLRLSRYEIRTFVLPLVQQRLGEIPPVKVAGLTSNWCGKEQMSRYGL